MSGKIEIHNISKFYGEVLGVNRVDLSLAPGITSLVGPNGSGKTTLMNLITGLLRPTRGHIEVLGISTDRPEDLFRVVGYCTQFDAFPQGLTGRAFVEGFLGLHGASAERVREQADRAIGRVGLLDVAHRPVAAYSKGMRQRIKLAQAIAHEPKVLILDEPLNGLDPMARAEVIALFRELAAGGCHVIVSSHILHEVDLISDRIVLIQGGYVVADGGIGEVREDVVDRPVQVLVRCDRPARLAARVFGEDAAVEAEIQEDGRGLLVRTKTVDAFHLLLNRVVVEDGLEIETLAPADTDVHAVYKYLIESEGDLR